jgi:hypothetical protein
MNIKLKIDNKIFTGVYNYKQELTILLDDIDNDKDIQFFIKWQNKKKH